MMTDVQLSVRWTTEVERPLRAGKLALAHANMDELLMDVIVEAANNRHVPNYIRDLAAYAIHMRDEMRPTISYKEDSYGRNRNRLQRESGNLLRNATGSDRVVAAGRVYGLRECEELSDGNEVRDTESIAVYITELEAALTEQQRTLWRWATEDASRTPDA